MGRPGEGWPSEVSETGHLELDTPEANQAERLPERVARYGAAKRRALAMRDHLRANPGTGVDAELRARAAAGLRDCGEYLAFRHYFTVGEIRLHAACFCKQHLVCPLCAIRRGSKTLEAYLARLEIVQGDRGDLRPFLVTFTVKNGDDLAERVKHLRVSMQVLRDRRNCFRKGKRSAPWTEWAKVEGAFGSYEVTNIGNGWHPHLHVLVLASQMPEQGALQAEWIAITGDSFMVDVRPVQGDDLAGACMEVLKYAVKFGTLGFEDNWTAYRVLKGQRLIFSLGCLYGVKVPEILTDEPLEGLPFVELFYRYFRECGYSLQV